MDYTKLLDSYGGIIESDLKELFAGLRERGKSYHPFIADTYKAVEEFVLRGGRRLSACSTLIVYKGYTNKIDEAIVKISSGIELYRHSILVHDDIADDEIMRRSGRTLHETFADGRDAHFGMGSAIFAGNILYSLAIKAILDSGFDHGRLVKVLDLISSNYRDVNESQMLDLLFEYKETSTTEWQVMAGKRAASLFRTSMLAGAVSAQAPVKDMSILEDAARHIGYAFDIQDDIIDTFASKEQYGRDPCGDITKRKKPLHIIIALERDKRLASIMEGGNELTASKIGEIQEIVRSSGALNAAKSITREHAKEAERLITNTRMNEEAKDFFVSFIKYVDESLDWYK
ncbi:MAG: polyprenyl synthetase family protein [Methanotrichaceae archaeon]|nr:polyprenyl synthetase family protein [Methanotrichaceae archaeon]